MTTISGSIDDAAYEGLRRAAEQRRASPEELLSAYADYLAHGGAPYDEVDDLPIQGLMRLTELGGAFDWLKDEPDLYSDAKLEPYDQ